MGRRRLFAGVETDEAMLAQQHAGDSLKTIAGRYGVSRQRVSVRIARARERLGIVKHG
jgi:hypothetical protein